MSVLSSLRIALCCSLSLTIPLPISAAAEMLSPDAASAASGGERAITVAYLMPGDNSPMLAANKIVLNGMTAANAYYPRIRLLMVETSSDDKLEDQLKAAVPALMSRSGRLPVTGLTLCCACPSSLCRFWFSTPLRRILTASLKWHRR